MTVLEVVTGDLFDQRDVAALGHGVNCEGRMGAGIAVEFRRRFPDMFTAYARACSDGSLVVGGVFPWELPNGRWVYNLATQRRRGRDARLDAVRSSVTWALDHAAERGLGCLALPRIGAGIGGLDWVEVRDVLEQVAGASTVRLRVVSRS